MESAKLQNLADRNGDEGQAAFWGRILHIAREGQPFVAGVCLLAVLAATSGTVVGGKLKWRNEALVPTMVAGGGRDAPFLVRPAALATSGRELGVDWLQEPMRLPKGMIPRPTVCLHLMRIFGKDARLQINGFPSPISLLSLLTDEELSRKCIGTPTLVRTKYGIRFPTASPAVRGSTPGDEAHRDQCLACFAEFGIPLSQRIVAGQQASTLRCVLEDSLANFHLQQDEIAWTSLAYALYLPPVKQWKNRYGRVYCFDDLAKELLHRGLEGSCGGTHQLISLTILLRVDNDSPILSGEERTAVQTYVSQLVNLATRSQDSDGSWSVHWNHTPDQKPGLGERSAADTPQSRLLITGHLAEWMTHLPVDCKMPEATREAALSWLRQRLKRLDARQFWDEFCPYTHAICAIRDLSGKGKDGGSRWTAPSQF